MTDKQPPRAAIAFGAKTPDLQLPETKRYEVRDIKYPGLRLLVHPTGKKNWIFRYRMRGGPKQYNAPVGKWPGCTVAMAHAKAADFMEQIANGKNPLHVPSHPAGDAALASTDTSLKNVVKIYEDTHVSTLRKGTQGYVKRELRELEAALPGRDIASIKKADILAITDAAQKRGKHAKNQTLKTLSAFFRWCETDRGLIDYNPAYGIRKIKLVPRDRVLTDGEIKALWAKATDVNGVYGALVKLLLLSGARRNEIARLEWSEITEDVICLPAHRTKTNEPHVIPLTAAMKEVLATLTRKGKYVLGTGDARRAMSASMWAKQKLDAALDKEWRFHDLRRTFRTGLARLGVAREIAEACLNHKVQGIEGVYNLHDYEAEKLAAFTKWSAHVTTLTSDQAVAA